MRITWVVSRDDATRTRNFYDQHAKNPFVLRRIQDIKLRAVSPVRKAELWKYMLVCLLTTQQRSGPKSFVGKFVSRDPFPLSYKDCVLQAAPEKHVLSMLQNHGGIRRTTTIAHDAADSLTKLESGLWKPLKAVLENVRRVKSINAEQQAAAFIQDNFRGFGPKQSRNLLQNLGLSRYEIPIDSRITKWLNEFGFPIALTASALSDRSYYQFVSDGFQALSKACKIKPCLLDAAIFSSFDVYD